MKTVVCVVGGLGNQMFHAAYALALRTKGGNADLNDFLAAHGQSHYGSELMDVFHVKISKARYLVPFIWGIRKCIVFKEIYPSFVRFIFGMLWFLRIGIVTDYLKDRLSCPNQWLTICYGRFQSESHFKPVEKEVREMFRFDPSLISAANKKLAAEMESGSPLSSIFGEVIICRINTKRSLVGSARSSTIRSPSNICRERHLLIVFMFSRMI